MKTATPLSRAIGERLREVRELRKLTQDEVARAARAYGLRGWRRSTVTAVEAGLREISLQGELFLLLCALEIPLSDLLPIGSDRIELTSGFSIRSEQLTQMLTKKIYRLRAKPAHITVKTYPAVMQVKADAAGETEKKAAKVLGVKPVDVAKAARRLWGVSLPEERDRRLESRDASPRTIQALRGHVTRELLEELRGALR